jgi:hypothetical protein
MAKKPKKGKEEAPKRIDWSSPKEVKHTGTFRKLTPSEREEAAQWIKDHPESPDRGDECARLDSGEMVFDVLKEEKPGKTLGKPLTGEAVAGAPLEMDMILDFTGPRGSGSNIYHAFIYQVPKWSYIVKKVDESIQISPVYADLYNLVVGQKQKIEASIKTGLTSAAQAVADYELLSHDARRYGEMLDYFKEGQNDEHVLRSLFVDRVDAYTGEGYTMISMAKRWPTIITDFIRMGSPDFKGESWDDVKIIHGKLDVSMAEATVLKTKDRLFKEWKATFFPAVKTRYARIQSLLQARKKSIDEYRNWLKPYIAKYKTMKEADEPNPAAWVTDAYTTPGFGQSEGLIATRLWIWKVFRVWESGKPGSYKEKGGKHKGWVIYPYDDFVKRWVKRIEYKYNVRITDADVKGVLDEVVSRPPGVETTMMDQNWIYYVFFDLKLLLSLLRTPPPEGMESDNLMVMPLRTFYISQNVLLLNILEMKAKESQMVHYIDELIGASSIEDEILAHVEMEMGEGYKKKKVTVAKRLSKFKARVTSNRGLTMKIVHLFIRPGPYEPVFYERVSKMYSRAIGNNYGQITNFLKEKMQVGK